MSLRPCRALSAILVFIALLAGCQADETEPIGYIFHKDARSPEEVRNAGGFYPPSNTDYDDPSTYSLNQHADPSAANKTTAYVPIREIPQSEVNDTVDPNENVYVIEVTANMINLTEVLDGSSSEVVAMGGISWDAVRGWRQIPSSEPNPWRLDHSDAFNLTARDNEKRYKHPVFTANPDYRGERHDGAVAQTRADADVALLASEDPDAVEGSLGDAALRFMDRHGSAVGWKQGQGFPLRRPVTGSA
ncbi:hypothetical protein CP533_3723 [Ophiocordyceps camponoti-saundersi (nom. inval.)]|nr:hypothetical protein CP533_3723 [Ophiocordyceps camponoti-saundersi (nom. inval.)]